MLAGERANVEQPRLGRVERARVERQRLGRARNPLLGLVGFDQRAVERGQRLGQQRMVGRAALDPPRRLAQLRERAVRPAEQFVEPVSDSPALSPACIAGALLGQRGLLARLGRERLDLGEAWPS